MRTCVPNYLRVLHSILIENCGFEEHFADASEDLCVSFVMFSGVTQVPSVGICWWHWLRGVSTLFRTHWEAKFPLYLFIDLRCLYAHFPKLQDSLFYTPVGCLWNFPIFLSRHFKLVTTLRMDFGDFIYIVLKSAERNFHRGSLQPDGKCLQCPGTRVTKLSRCV